MSKYKYFFIAILTIIVAEVLYFAVIAPKLSIKKIILKSDINLSDEEIITLSGLDKGLKYYAINKEELTDLLEKNIAVGKIVIEKKWPDTIKIILEGHSSVASFINSQGTIGYIDSTGSIFSNLAQNEATPPLLLGLTFTDHLNYKSVAEKYHPLLSDLAYLKKHHLQLFSFIKSITIIDHNNGYYLVASFNQFSHQVIWPSRIDPKRLYNSLVLISLAKELNILETNMIDFRTDEIIYRTEGVL